MLEQENRIIRMSPSTILIVIAVLIFLLLSWFAVGSLQNSLPQIPPSAAPGAQSVTPDPLQQP